MCGIAGWITPLLSSDPFTQARVMADAIAHRGPDDAGYWCSTTSPGIGLAHRRLAIIDLSGSRQPMISPSGSIIIFNGEIYNFKELRQRLIEQGFVFTTQGDTEVLLHGWNCWGRDLLPKLRGMFAFAIWDPSQNQLFLARDCFGKKPLFITVWQAGIAFASEIKALLTLPGIAPRLNPEALGAYFAYRFVPGPATLFTGIQKLPAGHALIWEKGQTQIWRWYEPPDAIPRDKHSPLPSDPEATFQQILEESVDLRLMSDVPLGAFLSGGLDSSIIVALMARHRRQPVRTFSVGFIETSYSELPYARLVAEALGCIHEEIVIQPEDITDLLPRATHYRDAPVSEPADLPMLALSRAAAQHVKVVLTGEGSDEILGGYPKHRAEPFVHQYQAWVARPLRHLLTEIVIRTLPYQFHRIKTLVTSAGLDDFPTRMARWFGALTPEDQKRLTPFAPVLVPLYPAPNNSALRAILHFDQTVWLPDNLLERGDRMTMAAGLEARNPLLDHVLAAFVSSLPDRFRIKGRKSKWLLRQFAGDLLPPSIPARPKVGFRLPVNQWFQKEMRDFLRDHLDTSHSRLQTICDKQGLRRVIQEHLEGRYNHEKLLWTLLTLSIFLNTYRLEL